MSKLIVSAGIVPVRFVNDEPLFLLLRSFGSFWDHPKGRVEDGEELLDAAMREILEETSITKDELNFRWGQKVILPNHLMGIKERRLVSILLPKLQKSILSSL